MRIRPARRTRRSSRRAGAALALALGIVASVFAARCTFDGLDQYASGSNDGGPDGVAEGSTDGAPLDVSPACSACTDAQSCVQGKCETCSATWSVPYAAVGANGHYYQPSTSTLYVSGSRQVGDAAATGYFAFVDSCTGTLERALDPPTIGDAAVGSLGQSAPSGSTLFVGAGVPQPPNAGGYATFNLTSQSFASLFGVPKFSSPPHTDEIWEIATANGHLWMSGTTLTDSPPQSPVIVKSNGAGSACAAVLPYSGMSGRAIAATAADVYLAIAGNDVQVLHFGESSCPTTSPCSCAPSWTSQPFTLTNNMNTMGAHRSTIIGSTLYVVGWAIKQGSTTDWEGYVAQLDLASKAWGPTYTYDPTAAIDAFVNVATDGAHLYVSGESGWDGVDYATASSEVVVLPVPLVANSTATIIDVPPLRVAWSIDLDATGMVLTGASSGTDSRSVRCTRTSCPP